MAEQMRLHTIWGYWPDEDALELHGAVDEFTWEASDYYDRMLSEAREKFGVENVREVHVLVPWEPIVQQFEIVGVQGSLATGEERKS